RHGRHLHVVVRQFHPPRRCTPRGTGTGLARTRRRPGRPGRLQPAQGLHPGPCGRRPRKLRRQPLPGSGTAGMAGRPRTGRLVLARGDRGQPVEERHRHRGGPLPPEPESGRAQHRFARGRADRMSKPTDGTGAAARGPDRPTQHPSHTAPSRAHTHRRGPFRRALTRSRAWLPGLLLVSPSILLIGVFVYGMIGWNTQLALSDKHAPVQDGSFVGLTNFAELWQEARWPAAVLNAVVFTVVFVGGALLLGWLLGLLLDKGIRGEAVFRTLFLAPMAVSFIATGVVWRWLMNPAPAERATGLNALFVHLKLDFLVNDWWPAPTLGMAAMALPAIWPLSGYIMALFLAGFRGVPEDLREAARVDGCSEWGVYWRVVMPQLRPVMLSAVIIL